jgi:hypothetical protein
MLILIQILLQFIGFSYLSLSITRYYRPVTNQSLRAPKRTVWALLVCGYTLLLIAIILALNGWGVALGLVYSFATATLAATFLAILLAFKPHYLAFIAIPFKQKNVKLTAY